MTTAVDLEHRYRITSLTLVAVCLQLTKIREYMKNSLALGQPINPQQDEPEAEEEEEEEEGQFCPLNLVPAMFEVCPFQSSANAYPRFANI